MSLLCDPFRLTSAFVVTSLVFFTLHVSPTPHPSITTGSDAFPPFAETEIPPLWKRLGAISLHDIERLLKTKRRRHIFQALVDEYLAPWSSPTGDLSMRVPLSASLIDSMEVPNKASTARIRLSGDGRVLYRVLEHWEKTYRLPRLVFFMDLLVKMMKQYPQLRRLRCEFYLNTADGPRVTVDSMSQEFGALPMLAFRSEQHYIDIPVPDPVEHGSKVTGAGYVVSEDHFVPWDQKEKRVVFRGVASCIQKQHFGNWHLNPRVRVSTISARFPHMVDAGVTKWIKLSHNTTVEDVEKSANITALPPLTLEQQLGYRYILDVDGGLGSSRKRWMLKSGSTPFFQKSAVYQWYEPLLANWVHFVPVDRWFRDLIENVAWAQRSDDEARRISRNAQAFADHLLSEDGILEFLAVLLQKYAELQSDARFGNESVVNPCTEEPSIANGPMGCRTGWFRHIPEIPIPFGCRHKPLVEGQFVCHRPHPVSGRKEVKHGVYEPYPYSDGLSLPRRRPPPHLDTILG